MEAQDKTTLPGHAVLFGLDVHDPSCDYTDGCRGAELNDDRYD